MADTRRLTIGLPALDGQQSLEAVANALLDQTYTDYRLVIWADGSNEGTVEVCARLMARDRRVRMVLGSVRADATANLNAVSGHCRTELFTWAGYDALPDPTYLERCVAALDAEPRAALACSRARSLAPDGSVLRADWGEPGELGSRDPVERFRAALHRPPDPTPLPFLAVIRTEILARTGLLAPIPDGDGALVAELVLHGPLIEVPEALYSHRERTAGADHDLLGDSDPALGQEDRDGGLARWRLLDRHLESVRRRPPGVPLRPLLAVIRDWATRHRGTLIAEVRAAARVGR